MSAWFDIQSSSGSYSVEIAGGAFRAWTAGFAQAAVLSDAFFRPLLADMRVEATFLEAVETNKSLEATPAFIEGMRRRGVTRGSQLVAIGGGITQDVSAFIASVYMRGLRWTYVPTTVLAMVDSCIGGKSSINVGAYKNLVGTFHPPERVLIDPEFVKTLPADQQASGLIEAVKICFCRGAESFETHMSYGPAVHMPLPQLEGLIVNSLRAKKWFIEIDEFDKKERLLLNFGHTFGHAIEGASHFAIAHGIGVGLGIECAIAFQQMRGVDYAKAPHVAQLSEHLRAMVRTDPSVAATLRTLDLADVMERFVSDKKHGQDFYALILIERDGTVTLQKLPRTSETLRLVEAAVQRVIGEFA